MLILRTFLVLAVLLISSIEVSSQLLAQGQDEKSPKRTSTASIEKRGSESDPVVVKILPSSKSEADTKREEEERGKRDGAEQLKQKTDNDLVKFTGQLANYTWLLVIVGAFQFCILVAQIVYICRQEKATKTIERAYVKMSHTEEGLYIWRNETVRMCKVTVHIENCGKTPASVIDIRLNAHLLAYGDPLPAIPNYGESLPHGAPFLVPGDSFSLRDKTFPLGHLDAPNPVDGAVRFCLFGRIVYIDAFGKTHCAGYAREYLPVQGNNLILLTEPGYNYDRPYKG